jgi:hypothetical protein
MDQCSWWQWKSVVWINEAVWEDVNRAVRSAQVIRSPRREVPSGAAGACSDHRAACRQQEQKLYCECRWGVVRACTPEAECGSAPGRPGLQRGLTDSPCDRSRNRPWFAQPTSTSRRTRSGRLVQARDCQLPGIRPNPFARSDAWVTRARPRAARARLVAVVALIYGLVQSHADQYELGSGRCYHGR